MSARRVFIPVSSAEYGKLHGLTSKQVRARMSKLGGVKVGSRWQIPMLATDYAKRKGIRSESARRRKSAIRATDPQSAGKAIQITNRRKLVAKAADRYINLLWNANTKRPVNERAVERRMSHGTNPQLIRVANAPDAFELWDDEDEDYIGDDDRSILYYH